MKTSELIKKINELPCNHSLMIRKYTENNVVGLYEFGKNRDLIRVDSGMIEIVYPDEFSIDSSLSNAYELMFEYAKTPLEEREDEKKYQLYLPKGFAKRMGYLNFDKGKDEYFFADRSETCEIQTSFTQKEINAMPHHIVGLIKEEV